LVSGLISAQNDELFAKGNSLYNDGDYQEAILSYGEILKNGVHSSELYFNLANAYYKTNRVAPSIYYYEKALQLAPNDKEIKQNLSFAKQMILDDIESVPEIGLSKIFKAVVNLFTFDFWAKLAVFMVLLFVVLSLGYYFSYSTTKKRLSFLGGVLALALVFVTLFFAFQKYEYEQNNNPAIVFAEESDVKTEPNLRSEITFTLHEGTKVQALERYDENWTKIKLSDGKTGWISSEDIKLLNKF